MSKDHKEEPKQITDQSKEKVLLKSPNEPKLLGDAKYTKIFCIKEPSKNFAEKLKENKEKNEKSSNDQQR